MVWKIPGALYSSKHSCYSQGIMLFSDISSHKIWKIMWTVEDTKLMGSFTAVWTIGNLIILLPVTPVEIFTTMSLKENFNLNTCLTTVTCCHMHVPQNESEHLSQIFEYIHPICMYMNPSPKSSSRCKTNPCGSCYIMKSLREVLSLVHNTLQDRVARDFGRLQHDCIGSW